MKIYFTILLLLCARMGVCQSYEPILSDTNEWYVHFPTLGGTEVDYYYTRDTTINSQKFAKFYIQGLFIHLLGYLSEDSANQSLYFYDKDNNDDIVLSSQKLIYSFNINIGDTVVVSNSWDGRGNSFTTSKLVLRKINNGQLLTYCYPQPTLMPNKRVFILTDPLNPQDTINWIEGTGSPTGLLSSGGSICNATLTSLHLACHRKNGITIFYHGFWPCSILGEISQNSQLSNSLKLYPNPASTQLYLYYHNPQLHHCVFSISDMAGRLLVPKTALESSTTYEIPIQDWAQGLYFLEAQDEQGNIYTEKFIKE